MIVRGGTKLTEIDAYRIAAFGLDDAAPDLAGLSGWFVLSGLLVVLLLGWVWRFRRDFWHRNNVLVLISVLLLFATLALQATAGRLALPFLMPVAAIPILLAVLLDAEVAIVVTAILAVVAGAVNGGSIEIPAYIFLGGLAGVLAIRRGDRLQTFLQAGAVVFVVQALVVSAFSLLGERDITGILQLWGASALSAAGAAVAAVGTFAVLGNVFGILTVFQLLELANPSQPLLRRLLHRDAGHVPPLAHGRQPRRAGGRGHRRRPAPDPRRGLLPRHRQAGEPARVHREPGRRRQHPRPAGARGIGPGPQAARGRRHRHRLPEHSCRRRSSPSSRSTTGRR